MNYAKWTFSLLNLWCDGLMKYSVIALLLNIASSLEKSDSLSDSLGWPEFQYLWTTAVQIGLGFSSAAQASLRLYVWYLVPHMGYKILHLSELYFSFMDILKEIYSYFYFKEIKTKQTKREQSQSKQTSVKWHRTSKQ